MGFMPTSSNCKVMTEVTNPSKQNVSSEKASFLQQSLESIWYQNTSGKYFLYPLEIAYKALARLDRVIKTKQMVGHPAPIIIVGNISVGGTGKTPLVIYLCEQLKKAGYSPGIITRGYGGKSNDWPAFVGRNSNPAEYGDEPVLMAQRAEVPVVAGPNRNNDVDKLLKDGEVDVVISDDGLQHYALQRDIEIAVIDKARGLGNERCLPAGPLREPPSRLEDCDFIVFNEPKPASQYSMQLVATQVCNLKTSIKQPLSAWSGLTVHAVTGIGNPSRFFETLEGIGLKVIEHRFPDHYQFCEADITFNDDLPVVMTEKDAVKCISFASDKHWSMPIYAKLNQLFMQNLLTMLEAIKADNKAHQS
jgi:tetraacyldisaccharide 4'-kinase